MLQSDHLLCCSVETSSETTYLLPRKCARDKHPIRQPFLRVQEHNEYTCNTPITCTGNETNTSMVIRYLPSVQKNQPLELRSRSATTRTNGCVSRALT